MPQARTLIRSDPAPGSGIGLSTISSGPPGRDTCTARIVVMGSSSLATVSMGVYASTHGARLRGGLKSGACERCPLPATSIARSDGGPASQSRAGHITRSYLGRPGTRLRPPATRGCRPSILDEVEERLANLRDPAGEVLRVAGLRDWGCQRVHRTEPQDSTLRGDLVEIPLDQVVHLRVRHRIPEDVRHPGCAGTLEAQDQRLRTRPQVVGTDTIPRADEVFPDASRAA